MKKTREPSAEAPEKAVSKAPLPLIWPAETSWKRSWLAPAIPPRVASARASADANNRADRLIPIRSLSSPPGAQASSAYELAGYSSARGTCDLRELFARNRDEATERCVIFVLGSGS